MKERCKSEFYKKNGNRKYGVWIGNITMHSE